ncbi:MAG: methylenetetrahydrofolate reductase [NAD(P)H] [Pseudomonadales bacterium]|nr:methylenetetrahydrofolate reductase [NAD(P)H] [Pseudomonadales bacterium]MCP5213467.1 methylenetetrahydrofolate reductase [NAD(P)H] [Pseudomonadales bacterium]
MTQKIYSCEFFPPKSAQGDENLKLTWEKLSSKHPAFFSVTYGAGGSTRDKTFATVKRIKDAGLDVAPHLSFGGDNKEAVIDLLQLYRDMGINRLVALRGDLPSGMGGSHLVYASELVAFIRKHTGEHFHIEVAAYPEIHPQAQSYDKDIFYLKKKFDAGANSAITQYFYNADAYFYFIERCQAAGINKSIVPGIMPITNFSNLARFSDTCGAEIPRWIRKRLQSYADDSASILSFGIDVVTELCEKLLAGGAPGLHFYTMNKAEQVLALWENLRLDQAD